MFLFLLSPLVLLFSAQCIFSLLLMVTSDLAYTLTFLFFSVSSCSYLPLHSPPIPSTLISNPQSPSPHCMYASAKTPKPNISNFNPLWKWWLPLTILTKGKQFRIFQSTTQRQKVHLGEVLPT